MRHVTVACMRGVKVGCARRCVVVLVELLWDPRSNVLVKHVCVREISHEWRVKR